MYECYLPSCAINLALLTWSKLLNEYDAVEMIHQYCGKPNFFY